MQLEIGIGSGEIRHTPFKWNVAYLKGEFAGQLREKWESLPTDATFFQKLRHITRLYRQFSKWKAKEHKREELNARANLEVATGQLHDDIYNVELQGKVNQIKHSLEEIEARKARGATIRARVKWQKVGDKCSMEFFQSVRQKNVQTIISELRDNQGRCFTRKEDLHEICLDFYQNLYRHKENSREAMREVLDGLPTSFTYDMNAQLSRPITDKELSGAIMSMAKGKAPNHDGLPIEFFQCFWNTIGGDYRKMLQKGMEEGAFQEGVTKGLISLIPKEGDSRDLNYWRPITLLTASYKVFAKTLQLRFQPMLRDVISPEQTTFLPLRFILDNIVLTQDTLHWAKTSRQPTIFLKLDFSKAYDKFSWTFLFSTMRQLNISDTFIKWVKLLFVNASAAVNLNGNPGASFKIERGVRQGCP